MAKKETANAVGLTQLKNDLKQKEPGRFYILYGEEDYLRRYYLERIKKLILADGLTADFNFHRLTAENYAFKFLYDAIETLPMMAERSLVLLEDVDLFAEEEQEQLITALSDLPEHCCLVLDYTDFKPDKRKQKLWKTLQDKAVLVEFAYQAESDLRPWIARHFHEAGKVISPEMSSYLLSLCGMSMTRLHGEIEKICAYSGTQQIVRGDIDAVVEPTLDAVVFQITDALGQEAYDHALLKLNTLLKMQEDPIPIVAAIGAQMRRLYAAKVLQSQGRGAQDLAAMCGIAPYAAGKILTQARRFSERFCSRAVQLCAQTDYQIKTSYDTGETLAQMLILNLAQEARND